MGSSISDKLLHPIGSTTAFRLSCEAFLRASTIELLILVFRDELQKKEIQREFELATAKAQRRIPFHLVKGGKENEIASLGITGKTAFRHILDDYITDLDVLYSGNTSNPPQSLMSTTAPPDRSVANKAVEKYDKFEIPFIELNKAETIDLVKRLDIEWLFEASHTCTEFDVGRCYQQTETIHCWQCMERQWGFIENNMRDPGTK